jgi:hypothetical protein
MKDMELLSCPRCGSPAKMLKWGLEACPSYQYGQIKCSDFSCGLMMPEWNDIRVPTRWETMQEEEAIRRWNTRKKGQQKQGER